MNVYLTTNGATPLSYASRRGHLACVEYLIKHGAEIDAADYDGLTSLSWAARGGNMMMLC